MISSSTCPFRTLKIRPSVADAKNFSCADWKGAFTLTKMSVTQFTIKKINKFLHLCSTNDTASHISHRQHPPHWPAVLAPPRWGSAPVNAALFPALMTTQCRRHPCQTARTPPWTLWKHQWKTVSVLHQDMYRCPIPIPGRVDWTRHAMSAKNITYNMTAVCIPIKYTSVHTCDLLFGKLIRLQWQPVMALSMVHVLTTVYMI